MAQPVVGINLWVPLGCISCLDSALDALKGVKSLDLGVLLGLLSSISVLMIVAKLVSYLGR